MKSSLPSTLCGALLISATLGLSPLLAAEVVTSTSIGTVSEYSPDALVIRSETATAPVRYVLSRDVTYVDEAGAPVSMEVVRSGAPVTVHYVREGERSVVRRVVVRRVATAPTVVTQQPATVVVPAAPIIEKRTTTTTTTTTGSVKED